MTNDAATHAPRVTMVQMMSRTLLMIIASSILSKRAHTRSRRSASEQ
jgi:hypothetical protein